MFTIWRKYSQIYVISGYNNFSFKNTKETEINNITETRVEK
jgi:hypothetical protein